MHELSLVQNLIEEILSLSKKEKAKSILSVTVSLGAVSGIAKDAFEFAFQEGADGTLLKNTKLIIEEVPLTVHCADCGKESHPEEFDIDCKLCKSSNVKVTAGKDFQLKDMEID